jgi:hypothetical protein
MDNEEALSEDQAEMMSIVDETTLQIKPLVKGK